MKSYTSYEEFITKRRLVRPHLAKYYAGHVRTYLDFCGFDRSKLNYHTRRLFLQSLDGKLKDWQIRQTDDEHMSPYPFTYEHVLDMRDSGCRVI